MIISLIRTLILYIVIVSVLRAMGKRQIGELAPSELVVTILISELAAIPMQDSGIPLLHGIIPITVILTLLALEFLCSTLTLKSRKLRGVIVGTSSILIENGTIDQEEMHRLRLNLDELLEELRLKGHASLSQVQFAILETNGKLSVFPAPEHEPHELPITLISDGVLILDGLQKCGYDLPRVKQLITDHGCRRIRDVFLLQLDGADVLCIPKSK